MSFRKEEENRRLAERVSVSRWFRFAPAGRYGRETETAGQVLAAHSRHVGGADAEVGPRAAVQLRLGEDDRPQGGPGEVHRQRVGTAAALDPAREATAEL